MKLTGEQAMRRALELARQGFPRCHPNPPVGCVILDHRSRLAGEGWHRGPGLPHAEVEALRQAGRRARGGTCYVTLEPCAHQGRTGPCTQALREAGVAEVNAAILDPDPRVRGRGIAELRAAGMRCSVGLLAQAAAAIDPAYLTQRALGRPRVTLKAAVSLDGRVATRGGDSRWITSPALRALAHRLRHEHDAVLVGAGTALADDPALTTRLPGGPTRAWRQPLRVVLDARGRLPAGARVLTTPGGPVLIATTSDATARWRRELGEAGAEVMVLPGEGHEPVSWRALLRALGKRGVLSLLIEGGPTVAGTALAAGVVDEVVFHLAPLLIGGRGAPGAIGDPGAATLAEAWRLLEPRWQRVGEEMVVRGALHPLPQAAAGGGRAAEHEPAEVHLAGLAVGAPY